MRATEPVVASRAERSLWGALALGCTALLAIAAVLEPDPRGLGTHQQLGLPPCGFLTLTGLPCPGCGLTTAFAHGIRGDFAAAVTANPLGLLLFLGSCLALVLSVIALTRGWSFSHVFDRFRVDRWGLGLAVAGVAVWVVRLVSAAYS